MSKSSQESSTETIGSPTNNEFFAVWSITIVVIILLVILVFCIVFLKLSSKGQISNDDVISLNAEASD